MIPARGLVLLRPVSTEETQGGGKIIIPQEAREKLVNSQMEVVAVGEDPFCPDPEGCHRVLHTPKGDEWLHPRDGRVVPGAWVLVRPRSLVEATGGFFLVTHDDVFGVFLNE